MRNAPSVVYPVGRCLFHGILLALLGVLGLLVLVAWWWYGAEAPPTPGVSSREWTALAGLGLWVGWVVFAWRSWQRSPVGHLHWDALATVDDEHPRKGIWRWRSDAYREGAPLRRLELALDLQDRVLLRLRNPDAAGSWVWVERASDPARWGDFRRALMAVQS